MASRYFHLGKQFIQVMKYPIEKEHYIGYSVHQERTTYVSINNLLNQLDQLLYEVERYFEFKSVHKLFLRLHMKPFNYTSMICQNKEIVTSDGEVIEKAQLISSVNSSESINLALLKSILDCEQQLIK